MRAALDLLLGPGGVAELRAIGRDGRIASGYFDDPTLLAEKAEALDASGDYSGVYVTLNPVHPALLARRANRLRDAQAALDKAVGEAYRYGLPREMAGLEPLPLLLALNQKCATAEREGRTVAGPGLPAFCAGDGRFSSDDCLRMPER